MTFIGKILVIVIVAVSLIFLGISGVALSTAKGWTALIQKEQTTVRELQKKLTDAKAVAEADRTALADAKAQFEQEKKSLDARLTTLDDEIKRDLTQIKSVRDQLGPAHQKAKDTMAEVEAKRKQINDIRAEVAAVEKQSGEFKQHQIELTDLIREIERVLGTATQNGTDLQGR
jgi:chromosome segregation ATPase